MTVNELANELIAISKAGYGKTQVGIILDTEAVVMIDCVSESETEGNETTITLFTK